MPIYRIADLNIAIEPKTEFTERYLNSYLYRDASRIDFSVVVTREMIEHESHLTPNAKVEIYETTAIFRKICSQILKKYDGFFLHSSAIKYNGMAYLFTAPSGTGKSTHCGLWRQMLGDKVISINDDKPIIRKIDKQFYTFGNPWMGKENVGNNLKVPTGGVFILERSQTTSVEKINPVDNLSVLLNQTSCPTDKQSMLNLLSLLNDLFKAVPLYRLKCNMSYNAVKTVLSVIE